MDAVQRTLFPGGSDSVDDDACSVYTVEMVSAAIEAPRGAHESRHPDEPKRRETSLVVGLVSALRSLQCRQFRAQLISMGDKRFLG